MCRDVDVKADEVVTGMVVKISNSVRDCAERNGGVAGKWPVLVLILVMVRSGGSGKSVIDGGEDTSEEEIAKWTKEQTVE